MRGEKILFSPRKPTYPHNSEVRLNLSMLFHLHLVSDSTGETIEALARACLAQFEDIDIEKHHWNLVRSPLLLEKTLTGITDKPGLVLYTFVDEALRTELENFCHAQEIPCISVLKPVLRGMMTYFGKNPAHQPGKQHILDDTYFSRIDAMEYALEQDDGHGFERLQNADVVVLGVSRTSKTPTCIYLAGRGIRAANIPFIPGQAMPDLSKLTGPLIVGLTKDPDSLIAIRRNRLHLLGSGKDTAYVDPEQVRAELTEARRFFAKIGCPIIDVSRRSIEETASEIMMLLDRQKARHLEKTTS